MGRQDPNIDVETTYRILSIDTGVNVCKPEQQNPGQRPNFPKLSVNAGDLVEAQYLENGHIWQTLAGKNGPSAQSGTIYWYATQNPDPARTVDDVLKWTTDGSGGDGKGRLLSTSNFDDGICIETGHEVSTGRPGGPCKSYFRVPADAEQGKDIEVIWLWDYTWHFGPPKPGYIEVSLLCVDTIHR